MRQTATDSSVDDLLVLVRIHFRVAQSSGCPSYETTIPTTTVGGRCRPKVGIPEMGNNHLVDYTSVTECHITGTFIHLQTEEA